MNQKTKLILALDQIHNVLSLTKGNEYESYFVSHLFPIKFELERQLTNLNHSDKVTKS